jgi:ankyrin repeat protein
MRDEVMNSILGKVQDGRTDLVFDFVEAGNSPSFVDQDGVSLLQWCAYYGDVSAIKFLLSRGAELASLGPNIDLNGAVYHGHWQLTQFLLESGADPNDADAETGETPLHSAIVKPNLLSTSRVVALLLAHGANPNCKTKNGVITGAFMRDCRTKAETPLHRAAAFGNEETIKLLLGAGAVIDAQDANGDTPLGWASWYGRPNAILRPLLYGSYSIRPDNTSMESNLLGKPHISDKS